MTEKYYLEDFKDFTVITLRLYDKDKPHWHRDWLVDCNKIVDLLNNLHEENQDLATKKEDAEYELLHLKEKYEELLEENEQLKQQIKDCKTYNATLYANSTKSGRMLVNDIKELKEIGDYQADRIQELTEENMNLEDRIKEAYENERTTLGRSVLKQLLEAIQ